MTWVRCPACSGEGVLGIVPAISYNQDWMPENESDRVIGIINKTVEPTREDYEKLMATTKEIWKAYCYYYDTTRSK